MKKQALEFSPRYIVDEQGKKIEVVLDILTFEKMVEKLEEVYLGLQAEKAIGEGEFVDFDAAKFI